ncbi:MAG: XdhC family protein [Candidatus Eiseniibacteriota bacterium]|nr:MAG: XdhC family protein [Candidatus Eisenbacteria bacterium]
MRVRDMDIHRLIAEKREAGETFAVALIVRTAGSSPRDAGARMLVHPDGSILGTIGGGKFEKLVIDDCVALFSDKSPHLLKTYRFSSSGPDATGMCCGGEADVFMEVFVRPDRLLVFGGGHVGKELVRIAESLDFRITVVDDRKDILQQYHEPVETILTDEQYEKNFPSLGRDTYVDILTRSHACDR